MDAAIVDWNKYTTNQKSNYLIASPSGHGKTREEKRKKKERQKKAQEIHKRQKVINEEGYLGLSLGVRETILKIKTKINNDPIGKGDFF